MSTLDLYSLLKRSDFFTPWPEKNPPCPDKKEAARRIRNFLAKKVFQRKITNFLDAGRLLLGLKREYSFIEKNDLLLQTLLKTWALTSRIIIAGQEWKKTSKRAKQIFLDGLRILNKFIQLVKDPNAQIIIAFDKDKKAQALCLYSVTPKAVKIKLLMTNPLNLPEIKSEQKKKGAGSAIIEELFFRYGKPLILKPAVSAIPYYQKLGFTSEIGTSRITLPIQAMPIFLKKLKTWVNPNI